MWERIYNSLRVVFNLGAELKSLRDKNERMQDEIKGLTDNMQRLAFELEYHRQNEAHEREKLELRLKIEMLQRQLPPAPPQGE